MVQFRYSEATWQARSHVAAHIWNGQQTLIDGADLTVSFGRWVKRRRRALDLTQAELARRAGCSVFALRKIESEERRPSRQLAGLLAQSLGIPPDEQPTFVRVARGELSAERLGVPSLLISGEPPYAPRALLPHSTLPTPPTPFVGRQAELAALGQLVCDLDCGLITVTGPGGIGKTRLVLEVASRYRALFPDGVWFVPLASLSSSEFLVPTLASAVGLSLQGPTAPRTQLLNYLHTKHALLILDNVEHLLDELGLFADILTIAPGVRMVVTSRERLHLHGEWVFELQGMPVPSAGENVQIEEYGAVTLFLQSARRTQASFELQDDQRTWVVRICRLVEGVPLGIELAAAWVSVLSCQEIAREIERNLDFLTATTRDVPERLRSLRAAFDYSWQLLSPEERRVLCRLAVFQGGFCRNAAEGVAGARLPQLLALVSKSLLRRDESGRYDLHEVVQQYALAHLEDDPEADAVRDQHSDYYLALLRDREHALKSSEQPQVLSELAWETDNIHAAWAWAIQRDKLTRLGGAVRCFALLCDIRGWLEQGIEQLEPVVQALRRGPEDGARLRVLGQAIAQQGLLFFRKGDYDRAVALFEESLAILKPVADPALLVDPLAYLAVIKFLTGELEQSQALGREALAYAGAVGNQWAEALIVFNLGYVDSLQGNYAQGYRSMREGLARWHELGDPRFTALGLNFLSPTAIKLGRYREAQAILEQSLDLTKRVGDRWGMGTAYRHLGLLALAQGHLVEARSLMQQSLSVLTDLGARWDIAQTQACLAEVTAAEGDLETARQELVSVLLPAMEMQAKPILLDAFAGLARLYRESGRLEDAYLLSLVVASHPASTPEAAERANGLTGELEAQLSPEQLRSARERSAGQSLEAVVDYILADEPT